MNNKVDLPIVLIGGGGHASVLADILIRQERNIIAIISPQNVNQRCVLSTISHYKKDEDVLSFNPKEVLLVNGIGMMPKSNLKRTINEYFLSLGYSYESVIADSATISPYSIIKEGVQILQTAVVQAGATIGAHSIVNTGAIVEHDCSIGEYNHLAPKSLLCGQVKTEPDVFIGANSTVINNLTLKRNSIIAAGSVMRNNVDENSINF